MPHVIPALLVIVRLGGVMIFGPVFNSPVVPAQIRILFAFSLGLAVYPLLAVNGTVYVPDNITLWSLLPLVAMEVTFGAIIGYLAGIPLMAAQMAGLVMGQQMGLGFARFFNPGIDDEADVVGQLLFLMALGAFIAVGGLEQILQAMLHSFQCIPLGGFVPDRSTIELITGLLLSAFELALRLSAPLLALIFLETIAMGFVAKTVPQLNILSLGFPIRILAGLFIIAVGLVVIDEVMMEGIDSFFIVLFDWLDTLKTDMTGTINSG